ncbi:MAG: N-glycosylase/DNA lyase [Candidatus Omnitrophota bacterium]
MKISKEVKALIAEYKLNKGKIKGRLDDFKDLHKGKDEDIFRELAFCILTPQSKAVSCDKAIRQLKEKGLLLKGRSGEIGANLKGMARFHNKKAVYLVKARDLFTAGGRIDVKSRIDPLNARATREWLVENIKGFGYKEASHFLRNIGLGKDLAILDRHIIKNLVRYNAIDKVPPSIGSRKIYLEIEDKARKFCRAVKIPLGELDLLFWSIETGYIFK